MKVINWLQNTEISKPNSCIPEKMVNAPHNKKAIVDILIYRFVLSFPFLNSPKLRNIFSDWNIILKQTTMKNR